MAGRTATAKEQDSITTPGPLKAFEFGLLYKLGYTKEDVKAFAPAEARQVLAAKVYKPGSEAYLRNVAVNPMTGTVGLSESEVARLSNEGIAARQAERLQATPGLSFGQDEFGKQCMKAGKERFLVRDEYTGEIVQGADPLNKLLIEYAEANPGKRFRLCAPYEEGTQTGHAWQDVPKIGDKPVEIAGMRMKWMPEDVWERDYNAPNLARSEAMSGAIQRNAEDLDLAIDPNVGQHYAPIPASQRGPDGMSHPAGVVETARSNFYDAGQ